MSNGLVFAIIRRARFAPILSNYPGSPVDREGAITLQLTLAPMQQALRETVDFVMNHMWKGMIPKR
jgi:hypothetical protein